MTIETIQVVLNNLEQVEITDNLEQDYNNLYNTVEPLFEELPEAREMFDSFIDCDTFLERVADISANRDLRALYDFLPDNINPDENNMFYLENEDRCTNVDRGTFENLKNDLSDLLNWEINFINDMNNL